MIDTIKLLDLHTAAFPPALDAQAAANLLRLAQALDADPAMTDRRWHAYALATVRRECGRDYQPRTEMGQHSYFDKYEPGTPIGKRLGNTQKGDGYLFRGRGYVQITGRANYRKFSTNAPLADPLDLVANPDAALEPDIAYRILSVGMTRGLFTGKALHHYITPDRCDYKLARRIINGQDHAEEIAASAVRFQEILEACVLLPAIPAGAMT